MPLVGRRCGQDWLVICGRTRETVATYATQAEQWYHISHRSPPATRTIAERAMRKALGIKR